MGNEVITSLQARTGNIVDAVIFQYADSTVTKLGGDGGGLSKATLLQSGEHIISVAITKCGYPYWHGCLSKVEYTTNLGKKYAFKGTFYVANRDDPETAVIKAPDGKYISAFKGTSKSVSGQKGVFLTSIDIAEVADLEPAIFAPGTDGYRFNNSKGSFGYGSGYKIPLSRYVEVFGEAQGKMLYDKSGAWGGSCFGFSTSSVLFNQRYLAPSKYSANAKVTFDLPTPKVPTHPVTQLLERYQISWYKNYETVWKYKNEKVDELLKAIEEYQSTKKDPLVLFFYKQNSGHAVVAYNVTHEANRHVVHLYDNWDVNKTAYMYIPNNGTVGDISLKNQKGWKIERIGFIKASKVKERYLDKVGTLISVNGSAEITNVAGVSLANIDGVVEFMPAPGSELTAKLYQVPEDKYVFKPSSECSETVFVTVADEVTSISLEIPCETAEVGITLGKTPSVELSGLGKNEVNVDFLSTSSDFTEQSAVVTESAPGASVLTFVPQVDGVPMPVLSDKTAIVPSKSKFSKTEYGSTELKVSFILQS